MSEAPDEAERFTGARVLVAGQVLVPTLYFAGVALPYLFLFTFKGTDHCNPPTGCQQPVEVMEGSWGYLAAAGIWAMGIGVPLAVVMLLATSMYLGVWRRVMSPSLRRWLVGSALCTLAFVVFYLSPPGRLLLTWVVD